MSMHNYCCGSRGLVLFGENLDNFLASYREQNNIEDEIDFNDLQEYFMCSLIWGDESEDVYISDLKGKSLDYDYENIMVLEVNLPIYTFIDLLTKGITKEMIIDEIKKDYGKYLPQDFDYEEYIAEVNWVCYG